MSPKILVEFKELVIVGACFADILIMITQTVAMLPKQVMQLKTFSKGELKVPT